VQRHRSRFNLRQIENFVDQGKQIRPGLTNGAGVLDLLRRQILVAGGFELLRQNQQAIERRAQLV
jgi:hypothetical protein